MVSRLLIAKNFLCVTFLIAALDQLAFAEGTACSRIEVQFVLDDVRKAYESECQGDYDLLPIEVQRLLHEGIGKAKNVPDLYFEARRLASKLLLQREPLLRKRMEEIAGRLQEKIRFSDFFDQVHRILYTEILKLHKEKKCCDQIRIEQLESIMAKAELQIIEA